jgi:protein SCO1/2
VRLSYRQGKPLLVSFIYTGCFQVCPTQTRALYEAVQGLDRMLGEHQFNVVSIGFNQPFDSPDAMRAFAAQNRIGYRNWEFLSAPAAVIEQLTRAFGFSATWPRRRASTTCWA